MNRRIALTLASSAAVCALAVSLTTAFPNTHESDHSLASNATETNSDSTSRSGYIVASS